MDMQAKKSMRLGRALNHLNINQKLDVLLPTLFPSTVLSLVNFMRDSSVLSGQRSPREQFVQDQFQLAIYDLVRLVRRKDISLPVAMVYLQNLGELFGLVLTTDADASAAKCVPIAESDIKKRVSSLCQNGSRQLTFSQTRQYFIKYFYRLTIALNPLVTYLERAQGHEVTDWTAVSLAMADILSVRLKKRPQVKVFPKLSKFVLGPTLSVRDGFTYRKASFGGNECVLRFAPFRAENARCRSFVAEKEAATILKLCLILDVYACFNTKGAHVYCTEYVKAVSSYKVLVQAKYFEDRILRVVLGQVGLALDYLHRFGIIHRDLYMPNILMMLGCRVKLTGLQNSKVCMGRFKRNFYADKVVEFELGDEVLGSNKYYMAPELLAGKHYGRGVDWWSLGITCFHLASGTQPFGHLAEAELIKIAGSAQIEWPRFRDPSWQLQKFVTKCLQPVDSRMNFEEFVRHSFFEGLNWTSLYRHEFFEHFPELNLAFSHGKDEEAESPSPSPSAEKDTRLSTVGCLCMSDRKDYFTDLEIDSTDVFTYASEKYAAAVKAATGHDETESAQCRLTPPQGYTCNLEKITDKPVEIVISIFRRKFFCYWESWGFEVEEHINHRDEPLVIAINVEAGGCADCGGLMNGDVIVGIGNSSFWPERSLKKDYVDDLLDTDTDVLNLKVVVTSTERILQERQDCMQTIHVAPRHTVILSTVCSNTKGPEDFGLKLQTFNLPKASYILVDRLTEKSVITFDDQQLGLLNGDVVISINGAKVPTSMDLVVETFKGWTTGATIKIKAVAISALRPEVSWHLWQLMTKVSTEGLPGRKKTRNVDE